MAVKTVSYLRLFFLLAALLLQAGCASRAAVNGCPAVVTEVADDDDDDDGGDVVFDIAPGAGRIGILEAEVFMYDVSAGGIFEFRDDWSRAASGLAAKSAALTLKRYGYNPLILPDPARKREFFRLKTQMGYHGAAFQSDFFADKKLPFGGDDPVTYSLGSIEELCDLYGVDAFLYVYGFEESFSAERRKLLSESGGEAARPERTFVAVILAERDGRITWYKHIAITGAADMRREAHSLKIMGALFD